MDFDVWERKDVRMKRRAFVFHSPPCNFFLNCFFGKALAKAQEVQAGLWLLQQALNLLRTSVSDAALHSHIDNAVRNVLSVDAVLRSLNIQVSRTAPPPPPLPPRSSPNQGRVEPFCSPSPGLGTLFVLSIMQVELWCLRSIA